MSIQISCVIFTRICISVGIGHQHDQQTCIVYALYGQRINNPQMTNLDNLVLLVWFGTRMSSSVMRETQKVVTSTRSRGFRSNRLGRDLKFDIKVQISAKIFRNSKQAESRAGEGADLCWNPVKFDPCSWSPSRCVS